MKLKEMLESKKFKACLIGIIVTAVVGFVPSLEGHEDTIQKIGYLIIGYMVSQGWADSAKN